MIAIVGMTSKAKPIPHFQSRNQATGERTRRHAVSWATVPRKMNHTSMAKQVAIAARYRTRLPSVAAHTSWATVLCSTSSARCQRTSVDGSTSAPRNSSKRFASIQRAAAKAVASKPAA